MQTEKEDEARMQRDIINLHQARAWHVHVHGCVRHACRHVHVHDMCMCMACAWHVHGMLACAWHVHVNGM